MAGCRLFHETYNDFSNGLVGLMRGTLGPGNAVSGGAICLTGSGVVFSNSFGYNPLTGENAPCFTAMHLGGDNFVSLIVDNVISATDWAVSSAFGSMVFKENLIGVRRGDLAALDIPGGALSLSGVSGTIGPDNVIRARLVGVAIQAQSTSTVAITRNNIIAHPAIRYLNPPPVTEPSIVSAGSGQVTGTCPVSGRIEVFGGEAGQAETFLGEVECGASGTWTLATSATPGKTVTASLTDTLGRTSVFSPAFEVL